MIFTGYAAFDRFALLGDIDGPESAFADLLQDPVAANHGARSFFWRKNQCLGVGLLRLRFKR